MVTLFAGSAGYAHLLQTPDTITIAVIRECMLCAVLGVAVRFGMLEIVMTCSRSSGWQSSCRQ